VGWRVFVWSRHFIANGKSRQKPMSDACRRPSGAGFQVFREPAVFVAVA
jgi:hypothetical protein